MPKNTNKKKKQKQNKNKNKKKNKKKFGTNFDLTTDSLIEKY